MFSNSINLQTFCNEQIKDFFWKIYIAIEKNFFLGQLKIRTVVKIQTMHNSFFFFVRNTVQTNVDSHEKSRYNKMSCQFENTLSPHTFRLVWLLWNGELCGLWTVWWNVFFSRSCLFFQRIHIDWLSFDFQWILYE